MEYINTMNVSFHVCTRMFISSPSKILKQNFAYIKTRMDCIVSDMDIFWEINAATVRKWKD